MFDRTTWIALALSIAGLVGWQWYYNTHYAPLLAAQHAAEAAVTSEHGAEHPVEEKSSSAPHFPAAPAAATEAYTTLLAEPK